MNDLPPSPRRARAVVRAVPPLCALAAVLAATPVGGHDARLCPRVAVCFAPDTPVALQDTVAAKVALFQADDDARWSATATDGAGLRRGDPTVLTWGIVPDGTPIAGEVGEPSAASDLRAFLDDLYGSEDAWLPLFQGVFDRWSELTGITYVHESADDGRALGTGRGQLGVRPDIRIGGHPIDGNSGTLAYNFFPDDGDMVIDTADSYFSVKTNGSRRLRNVVAHEHGHGLGLDHVCPVNATKLMEPTSSTIIDGPQLDDVLAAQRLYGDRLEPSDTPATAADLGTLAPGGRTVVDVSIDGADDSDVLEFEVAPGSQVDVALLPHGTTYSEGPQNANGTCSSGTAYDSLRRVDLSLELLQPDGTSRFAFADSRAEGESESLLDLVLDRAGPWYLRVRGDGTDDVQAYRLVITVVAPTTPGQAVDDVVTTTVGLPVSVDVLANDAGANAAAVQVTLVSEPLHGAASERGAGVLRYAPGRGFVGEDSFAYRLRDATGSATTATVRVTVEASQRAGAAAADTDGDGYPDELEEAAGTAVASAASAPATGVPTPLRVDVLKGRQRFRKVRRDTAQLRGALALSEGQVLDGANVLVSVGGATRRFTLDARGRARQGADRLRISPSLTGDAAFQLRLRRADLVTPWSDEGLRSETGVVQEYRRLTAFVVVGGRAFETTLPLAYTVKGARGQALLLPD